MLEIIPSKKFLKDLDKFHPNPNMRKKLARTLVQLQNDPLHAGLHLERIVKDPSAWSIRLDRRYRISIEPEKHLLFSSLFYCMMICTDSHDSSA